MALQRRASAHYLPKRMVTAEELDHKLNLEPGTCRERYGVDIRHVAGEDENALYMGAKAASRALSQAGLHMNELDVLIWASATSHQALPYNGAGLLAHLGATESMASFDINTSCLSFLSALEVSQSFIESGRHKNIMVVSSEMATVGVRKTDVEHNTMFADGAAAFIFTENRESRGLVTSSFKTYPKGYRHCQIRGGGTFLHPSKYDSDLIENASYFEMEGKQIYRCVAEHIEPFVQEGLHCANLTMDDIQYVVPHQASFSALTHIQKRLKIPDEKFINIYKSMGNQVGASLPMTLNHLVEFDGIDSGLILLIGSGAGLSLGMGVLEL